MEANQTHTPNIILSHCIISKKNCYKVNCTYYTYLCQWSSVNNQTYTNGKINSYFFHPTRITSHEQNLNTILNYYTQLRNDVYIKLITKHFVPLQIKDTKYIFPALHLPLINISIHECNFEKDINTWTHVIKITNQSIALYNDIGKHIINIPIDRLPWL